ncbi:hypothetical protein [Methylobacterium sp. E-066]|uniref:hypothetical protein n=1 Tax=Methylobacterium sp. E-066 TaxID=2836584 RepID=UPI003918A3F3
MTSISEAPTQTTAPAASRTGPIYTAYAGGLRARDFPDITNKIVPLETFSAEGGHQQYPAKNPTGYCGFGGTRMRCPVGTGIAA